MTRGSRDDLHGDLAVLGPEIVLQMLAQARAGGLLLLASPPDGCWIALRQGRITAAGQGKSPTVPGESLRGEAGSTRASQRSGDPSPGSGAASRARKRGQEARAARVPSEAEARSAGAERPPRTQATGRRTAPAAGAGRSDLIREQVRAVLGTALGWRKGEFSFRSGVHPEGEEVQLEVEELLLDCMTRLDRARAGRGGTEGV